MTVTYNDRIYLSAVLFFKLCKVLKIQIKPYPATAADCQLCMKCRDRHKITELIKIKIYPVLESAAPVIRNLDNPFICLINKQ